MICTFFGHSDTPQSVDLLIEQAVREVLERDRNVTFYVGDKGNFDRMALSVLKRLSDVYPHIDYAVVLAYLSTEDKGVPTDVPTLFPEGIENTPIRFAISYRNKWMVKQADTVICYIARDYGGAAQFVKYARKQGKEVINLYSEY